MLRGHSNKTLQSGRRGGGGPAGAGGGRRVLETVTKHFYILPPFRKKSRVLLVYAKNDLILSNLIFWEMANDIFFFTVLGIF